MTTCISCQPGWGNAQNLSSQCRNHLCLFLYYKGFDWTENQTIAVLSDIRLPQFINNNNKLLILILLIIIIVIVIIIVIIVSLFTLCSIYSSIFGAKQIHETNNLNQTLQG